MENGNVRSAPTGNGSPFEQIRRINAGGGEFWSSREFADVLGYTDYRNFEQVIQKARLACFNSGQKVEDHFVDVTEMIEIGKGGSGTSGTGRYPRSEIGGENRYLLTGATGSN
jgi:DNA-damage-inducible protein D